jgi:hypothetical protein
MTASGYYGECSNVLKGPSVTMVELPNRPQRVMRHFTNDATSIQASLVVTKFL